MRLAARNRIAALATAFAGLLAMIGSAIAVGSQGWLSALVGAALVVAFFLASGLPLLVAGDGQRGQAGMGFLVLLMTYVLRLLVAIGVLTVAATSGAVDRRAMGLTVIGCALVWTTTQVVLGARRSTQPTLDL